jgi:hypothetical protein
MRVNEIYGEPVEDKGSNENEDTMKPSMPLGMMSTTAHVS